MCVYYPKFGDIHGPPALHPGCKESFQVHCKQWENPVKQHSFWEPQLWTREGRQVLFSNLLMDSTDSYLFVCFAWKTFLFSDKKEMVGFAGLLNAEKQID